MEDKQQITIIAVVTSNPDGVKGGGAPIFITDHQHNLQRVANRLGKILDASAHEIDEETMILVLR